MFIDAVNEITVQLGHEILLLEHFSRREPIEIFIDQLGSAEKRYGSAE
jgi:hypothetical protein